MKQVLIRLEEEKNLQSKAWEAVKKIARKIDDNWKLLISVSSCI